MVWDDIKIPYTTLIQAQDWNDLVAYLKTRAATTTIGATEPSSPTSGDYWFDIDENALKIYVNDTWRLLGEQGPIGPQGPAGSEGKSVLHGSGAPTSDIGVDGEFYIDESTWCIHGPKVNGEWTSSISLVGPERSSNFRETFPMVEVTGVAQIAEVNHSYLVNSEYLATIALPETAAYGDLIEIIGKGIGGWKVEQRENQYIRIGEESTTVGITGSIGSTSQHDVISLKCTAPNVEWTVNNIVGNVNVN